jgi:hypothetical protein
MVLDSTYAADPSAKFDFRHALRPRLPDPDSLLTRPQTAAALTAAGYPIKERTLARKGSQGGGPSYRLFNMRAIYRWADALAWAQAEMQAREIKGGQKGNVAHSMRVVVEAAAP